MADSAKASSSGSGTPWHIWVVGILAVLWNAAGAYTIMLAQAGRLPDISAEEIAYYASQPLWFVIVTDIALLSAIAGAIAILLRRGIAAWLFAVSLAAIIITDTFDFATGMSADFITAAALVATAIIFILAVLELVYTLSMRKRGVLR